MPWMKVDDTLAFHSKTIEAGNAAMGLWVRAGSWSMSTLSDGFIPDATAELIGTKAQARALVAAGLWHRKGKGYEFHEWKDRQPTKAQVNADRAATKERQRASRERRREGVEK